ncbi:MAG: sodium:proton antiporter, partial [Pseudomonadota bacterium]
MTDPATQIVVLIAGLLLAAGLISALAKQTRLPETVYLTVFGLLIGGLLRLLGEGVGDGWMWLAPNDPLPLSSEALLFIFLPPFLFAAGLQIDVRRMQDDVVTVIVLAVLAVIVCTLVVAVSIELVVEVSILLCFLLSSIVATTDAAAILSVFRDLGAPRRLTTLVEGESLFNDAAAIAIFSALISFVAQGLSPPPLTFLTLFVTQLLGGLLVGFAVARLIVWLVRLIEDVPLAEISLTIALAYLSYFVAEGVFSVSGTIAVVTSAIVFGLDGRTALSPGAWRNLSAIWEILDYWATALVVLLVAIAMPLVVDGLRASDFVVPLVIFVSAIVARIIVLFGLFPLLSRLSLFEPVSMPFRLILTWGGLRGVVTILLALSVLDVPMLGGQEAQRFLLVSAVLYVLLTLLVQATTLRPLMRLLKLNKLTPEEEAYLQRFRRHLSQRVVAESEEIGTAAPKHALPAEGGLEAAPDRASRRADGEPNELQVALVLLATHERELYFNYFSRGIIGRRLAESLRTDAERVLEGARSGGAQGYMQNALRGLAFGPWFGFAQRVLNWTGWEGPLRARLARRFEMSAVKLRAFSTLKHFAAGDIRPVVGEDIWLRIDELIDTRA